MNDASITRIAVAYSGSLATSVAIPWLAEQYQAEIVTVTLDLGQGRELTDIRDRALAVGAARAHVIDAREAFARDYILPALQAGALHEGRYPLAAALGHTLIAKQLVDVARMEGASAIAHGSAHEVLDASARTLAPSLPIIAPARIWGMSKPDAIEYARARSIPVPDSTESPYHVDANLWGRSIGCGTRDDPRNDLYTLTRAAQDCPDEPAYVEVEFEAGGPIRANGIEMPILELMESFEIIAGAHGVGRIGMGEGRLAGPMPCEVYEAPAAVVLHTAHKALETLVTSRDLERPKHDLARAYAELAFSGQWFSHTREAIDAFVRAIQSRVTGAVRLQLFKGDCRVTGRRSPFALEDHSPAPLDSGDRFDRAAAEGIIL